MMKDLFPTFHLLDHSHNQIHDEVCLLTQLTTNIFNGGQIAYWYNVDGLICEVKIYFVGGHVFMVRISTYLLNMFGDRSTEKQCTLKEIVIEVY